jgi:hypothetical protein
MGELPPTLATIENIAQALGVSMEELPKWLLIIMQSKPVLFVFQNITGLTLQRFTNRL